MHPVPNFVTKRTCSLLCITKAPDDQTGSFVHLTLNRNRNYNTNFTRKFPQPNALSCLLSIKIGTRDAHSSSLPVVGNEPQMPHATRCTLSGRPTAPAQDGRSRWSDAATGSLLRRSRQQLECEQPGWDWGGRKSAELMKGFCCVSGVMMIRVN